MSYRGLLLAALLLFSSCDDGSDGAPGAAGTPGTPGLLRLVAQQVVNSGGIQTVDFNGLDGDTDRVYVLHVSAGSQYGPGAPRVTFTTSLGNPAQVQVGNLIYMVDATTATAINAIDGNAINLYGPNFPGTNGAKGSCEMLIMAESGAGIRSISVRGGTDLLGQVLISGQLPDTGKLTGIHVTATTTWGLGSRFQLYAYGP